MSRWAPSASCWATSCLAETTGRYAHLSDDTIVDAALRISGSLASANRLKLTDSKTGARTAWLGIEARALIDSLPRKKTNPWLFWNPHARRALGNVSHYWSEMRESAGLPGVRIHDLRHKFASLAAMNQETLPMIGRLLGHVNPRSTARCAHLDDDHVLDVAQRIGDVIERMMGWGPTLSLARPRTSGLQFYLKLLFYKECRFPGELRCHMPPEPTSFPKCR